MVARHHHRQRPGKVLRENIRPQPTAEGKRRHLTVLFCDMVDSPMANRVDPEVLQRIIRSYEDACGVH
jgi:class 3 adenylate cyclase